MCRKPNFTGQYIHWDFFSLMKQKINLVATLVHQALFICSSSKLQAELDKTRPILVMIYLMSILTILLHPHFPRRSDNSTSHLNIDPRNARFISILHGCEMLQPNLKSKLLQPFSVATSLWKHVLFLQPSLFFPQPRRMYYLPITTTILCISLCAIMIVGT